MGLLLPDASPRSAPKRWTDSPAKPQILPLDGSSVKRLLLNAIQRLANTTWARFVRLLSGIVLLTVFNGCAHIAKQFEDADNEASAARHLTLAGAGDLESAYYVAFFYEVGGIGLPKDLEKARYWLMYAAEGNYADAQCSAGSSYEDGVLFEQDSIS